MEQITQTASEKAVTCPTGLYTHSTGLQVLVTKLFIRHGLLYVDCLIVDCGSCLLHRRNERHVILLPGCFLKTFIDIMFFSLLFYVFTFLFNMYRLLFAVILSRLTSCN